ncbi:MAG: hypothetical protein QOF78_4339 [Phycisphaerales bacterium]|jgi:VanZ family protein|nr:hypothetical protein [Phycisphaerales bacterium]
MLTTKALQRTIWIATAALWLGLFVLTHTPIALPVKIISSDKTAHFLGYAILGGALYASLRIAGRRDVMLTVLVIGLMYGAVDEWLQIPVGRSCELNDWFADAAGIAVAVTICELVARWRKRRAERATW